MSVNKAILIGNLGKDPEVRFLPPDVPWRFPIATSEVWTDGGHRQERTEWHNIIVWGKQGEMRAVPGQGQASLCRRQY